MKTTKIIGLLVGLTFAATSLFSGAASAATGNLFLTPNSGTYDNGTAFTVTVHENADNVNVVTAKMTYEASKLSCEGVGGSSAFPQNIAASCSNGNITISRYTASDSNGNPTTVSGDQVVGTVTFRALVGSGTAAVNFAAGSQIASNGSNVWNGGTTGGTYTLTTAAPAPVQGGQGGGSSAPVTSTPAANSTNRAASNNTVASTDGTTPAASDTPAATGDVKADATKKDAKKSDSDKQNTAAKKSGRTVWPWIILIVLGAAAVAYGMRNRKAVVTDNKAVVTDAKPKADKADKAVKTAAVVPAAVVAKKAAAPAKKTAANKPATQNRKKSGKKAGKKSR